MNGLEALPIEATSRYLPFVGASRRRAPGRGATITNVSARSRERAVIWEEHGATVRMVTPVAPPEGWRRVDVDLVLPFRPPLHRPSALGGMVWGRSEDSRSGVIVVCRSGGCASAVLAPDGATFDAPHSSTPNVVIAAVAGLRATVTVAHLVRHGVRRVLVVGAGGATGCLLGGIGHDVGLVIDAWTTRLDAGDVLPHAGFTTVHLVEHYDVPAPVLARYDALVDCTGPQLRCGRVHHTDAIDLKPLDVIGSVCADAAASLEQLAEVARRLDAGSLVAPYDVHDVGGPGDMVELRTDRTGVRLLSLAGPAQEAVDHG